MNAGAGAGGAGGRVDFRFAGGLGIGGGPLFEGPGGVSSAEEAGGGGVGTVELTTFLEEAGVGPGAGLVPVFLDRFGGPFAGVVDGTLGRRGGLWGILGTLPPE